MTRLFALLTALLFALIGARGALAGTFESELLATVTVAGDGTLAFADRTAAERLLAGNWSGALAEMEQLNGRIRSGVVEPFANDRELLTYRLKPMGSCTVTDELQGAFVPQAELGTSLAAGPTVDGEPAKNCFCKDKCCSFGLCCKKGWSIFCWGYSAC